MFATNLKLRRRSNNKCHPQEVNKMGNKKTRPVDYGGTETSDDVPPSTCNSSSSGGATSPSVATAKSSAPSLREGMMRQRSNCDPMKHYEIMKILGAGSMGSVSMVKKRSTAVGGSARPHNVVNKQLSARPHNVVNKCGRILPSCFDNIKCSFLGGIEKPLRESLRKVSRAGSQLPRLTETDSTQKSAEYGDLLQTFESDDSIADDEADSMKEPDSGYEIFYALKSIHLKRVSNPAFVEELRNEIKILKTLDHPYIVRPMETYEYRKQIFLVMELCSGGDLYSRDPYTEEEAARITGSILSAISFMHSRNVIHRDLKYENVLFVNKSPRSHVKLVDFGLSKAYGPNEFIVGGVGTIYTMAPEVIRGRYTYKADMWSLGVIAYMLLSSHMPFYGMKRRIVVEKILRCNYEFSSRRWQHVSPQAINFVAHLLQAHPDDRPSADEAFREPWLSMSSTATTRWPADHGGEHETLDKVQVSIETFAEYSKLKKLALMVVAHKSTSEEIGYLRKAFQKYDVEKTGAITRNEFEECLCKYGYTAQELDRMFDGCDIDQTGMIRYTEFLAATIEAHGAINEERLAEAFDRLDCDDSGYITTKNLREVLGSEFPKDDVDSIIDEADITRDHKISYEEFLALWDKEQEDRRDKALSGLIKRRFNTRGSCSLDVSNGS